MTLVVTSVSSRGITVVGDKAATWEHGGQIATSASESKVFVSRAARIAVALWGSTRWPGGQFSRWISSFVDGMEVGAELEATAERLAAMMRKNLADAGIAPDRRGIHIAGFVEGVPHLYHIHSGVENQAQHPPALFRDYPDIHCASADEYAAALERGEIFMLRNGRYDLHALVGGPRLNELRDDFRRKYGVPLPELSVTAELRFSAGLVRFAASILSAAGAAPTVSEALDGFAFGRDGEIVSLNTAEPVQLGDRLLLLDAETAATHSLSV